MDKITRGPDSTVEKERLPDEELVTVVEMSSVYMCHEDEPEVCQGKGNRGYGGQVISHAGRRQPRPNVATQGQREE